ncbi:MAG: trypsin-like peptidase domain-containing protein [Pseudomonadota bacterium]
MTKNLLARLGLAAMLLVAGTAQAVLLPQPELRALGNLDALPLHSPSTLALQKALAEPLAVNKSGPLRVAVKLPLALSLADGLWDEPSPGNSRWRLRVSSGGAKSLALAFSQFRLPADAGLWLYDTEGSLLQGPYVTGNETPEGRLWTALVPAEMAVVELRVPTASKAAVALQLASLSHGTQDFEKAALQPGTAGSCNIDVACTQGDNYRNEIRSTAVYTVESGNSVFTCSGQLVNNLRQDSTPFFLTANHCKVTAATAGSMVLYWNFQRANCGGGSSSLSQTQTGATYLASEARSDFALVRLSQAPSAGFNVYYMGWDVGDVAPTQGAAIHHPQGDVKKIALYGSGTRIEDNACAASDGTTCEFRVDAWRVVWTQGTTEGGSSGSGLLNQNRRLIGVLSGGGASCSSLSEPDYFGRLGKAWRTGCTSSSQLKAWLDPDNSGRSELCGQNPGSPCNTSIRTSGTASPGVLTSTGSCGGAAPLPGGSGALNPWLLAGLLLAGLRRRR